MGKPRYTYMGWYEAEHSIVTGEFHKDCMDKEGADYELETDEPESLATYCDYCHPDAETS